MCIAERLHAFAKVRVDLLVEEYNDVLQKKEKKKEGIRENEVI